MENELLKLLNIIIIKKKQNNFGLIGTKNHQFKIIMIIK